MLMLTKILSLLVYPLSLGLVLLFLSVLGGMTGRRGFSWLMALLALIVLYVPSTEFGSSWLVTPLEGRHPGFSPEELPSADVIVLLGGATEGESRFGHGADFNNAADRVFTAAELYYAGKAPTILISGGSHPPNRAEADLLAEKFVALKIPRSALILETASRTTHENAVNAGKILKQAGYQHILLVTSGSHMRRALALFEKQGLQVTAAATDHQLPKFEPLVPGWLPTYYRLARSSRALHEHVGYWVYDMTGKI